jgi:hypothetical protein
MLMGKEIISEIFYPVPRDSMFYLGRVRPAPRRVRLLVDLMRSTILVDRPSFKNTCVSMSPVTQDDKMGFVIRLEKYIKDV